MCHSEAGSPRVASLVYYIKDAALLTQWKPSPEWRDLGSHHLFPVPITSRYQICLSISGVLFTIPVSWLSLF